MHKLIVPANIPTRQKDLFRGFSMRSAAITAAVTVISIFLAFLYVKLWNPEGIFKATLFVLALLFGTAGYLTEIPDCFNFSMHSYLQRIILFTGGQKLYRYKKR